MVVIYVVDFNAKQLNLVYTIIYEYESSCSYNMQNDYISRKNNRKTNFKVIVYKSFSLWIQNRFCGFNEISYSKNCIRFSNFESLFKGAIRSIHVCKTRYF